MSKIIKNNSGSTQTVSDVGITIPNASQYTIPQQDYLLWASSSDIVTQVGAGTLVVNDGSSDLSISDGVDLIKGVFPKAVKLVGNDGLYHADVELVDGKRKLQTVTTVQIDELLGFDDIADNWFSVTAGASGDTVRVQIPADSVDVTITLTASEAANHTALATKIVATLMANATFALKWRATKIKDNPIVHISSRFIGEIGERSAANSITVTCTGTTAANLGFNNFVRRQKVTSLSRDPYDKRYGMLGISGEVSVTPGSVSDLYYEKAKNSSNSASLLVDGSVTPVIYSINADSSKDIFIQELRFMSNANGVKFGQFMSIATLANGILVEIKSDDKITQLIPIKTTDDLKHDFTLGFGRFELHVQAGRDDVLATFKLDTAFPIRKQGTYTTDDYVKVTVRDNLVHASLLALQFSAQGFEREV